MNNHMDTFTLRKIADELRHFRNLVDIHVKYAQSMVRRYKGQLDTEAKYFQDTVDHINETLIPIDLILTDRGDDECQ